MALPWSHSSGKNGRFFKSLGKQFLKNPHFWAIAIIFIVINLAYHGYYSHSPFFDRWFPWFWNVIVFEFSFHIYGSLFLIPCIYATLAFGLQGALIAWLFSIGVMLPRIIEFLSYEPSSLLNNILILSLPLVIIAFLSFEIKLRERERKNMAEREDERQFYVSQVFKTQEDERQRIARELHDDITQNLLVIANRAQSMVSENDSKNGHKRKAQAEWIRDAVLDLSEDVRRLSLDLRPAILDNIGLLPAIKWLVNRLNVENYMKTKLVVEGEVRKLPPESDVIIFRIIQEALNNIRRHSKATKSLVTVEFSKEQVKITVEDNGVGFHLPKTVGRLAIERKLGIISMKQRASFLHGTLNIISETGKGTKILAVFET
jgi:two-component system sensor histidine kinase DegS